MAWRPLTRSKASQGPTDGRMDVTPLLMIPFLKRTRLTDNEYEKTIDKKHYKKT